MAKILFDIIHLCHLNFFKHAIQELHKQGHLVILTYLDRGSIKKVLAKELSHFIPTKIGTYSPTTIGKIPMTLSRLHLFTAFLAKEKPDITLGVGDFVLSFASRIQGISTILFYDDYEFTINYRLSQLFSLNLFVPKFLPKGYNIKRYSSFKELAYLHPDMYTPDTSLLSSYDIEPKKYVFIREVAGISMNYSDLTQEGLLPAIKHLKEKGVKVLLSLEDKSRKQYYEPYCTVLQEPLEDIYSLMALARCGISSGDSMAREMALLGVPCIYTGGRDMRINRPLISMGGVHKIEKISGIINMVDILLGSSASNLWCEDLATRLNDDLKNTTTIIIDEIEKRLPKK